MARKKFLQVRSKYKPKKPRPGSYTTFCARSKMPCNSDDLVKQWNGSYVLPKYWRPKHPHDEWPSIADEIGIGAAGQDTTTFNRDNEGNLTATNPQPILYCVRRDSAGVITSVYESTNPYTCEVASASQITNYQPTIADQSFSLTRSLAAKDLSIGTIVASDPNGSALTYTITSFSGLGIYANDTNAFDVNETTANLYVNYPTDLLSDTDTSYTLTVQTRNSDNLSNSATITINIFDVFVPTLAGSVGLWFDWALEGSVTVDGSSGITDIVEQTTTGYDFVQSNASYRPTYSIDHAIFNTSSTDDGEHLIIEETANLAYIHNEDSSIYLLLKPYDYTHVGGIANRNILANSSITTHPGFNITINYYNSGQRDLVVTFRNGVNTISTTTTTITSLVDAYMVLSIRFSETTGLTIAAIGNTTITDSAAISNAPIDANPAQNLFLGTNGSNANASTANFRGEVAALYIYDERLDDANDTLVVDALKEQGGIS